MYLNVKHILTFLVVVTPKISLIHKNNHICNIYTLGDIPLHTVNRKSTHMHLLADIFRGIPEMSNATLYYFT